MHENSKNSLVFLIVLAIALLPFRWGHEAGIDAHTVAGESNLDHSVTHAGDSDTNTHNTNSCDEVSPDHASVDDCCGDQCSTAQILLPSACNLHFSPSHSYDLVWSQWLPEAIVSAELRPPIKLS